MQDFKKLTWIVYFCVAGVAISFGGAITTAVQQKKAHQEFVEKQAPIPLPATSQ